MKQIPWEKLFQAARGARAKAYAPYSRLRVGAAVLTADGAIFAGCNIENSSYGLSACAERTALFHAVLCGYRAILAVAIVADTDLPIPPCGMCRQVMAEFAKPDLSVRSRNSKGREQRYRLKQLLPFRFSPRFLKKRAR